MIDQISTGIVEQRLDNKVVLITGVGGGQGREAAILFAKAGATVVGCDVKEEGCQETLQMASDNNLSIDISILDASNQGEVKQWVDSAVNKYGGIDVLYNNAGFAHFAKFEEMTTFQWNETLRLELNIVFFPTQAAWPHLMKRGGSIINISSVCGMRGTENLGAAAHAATKAGVIGLTKQLALEGGPYWIRVNSISPGPIVTPATQAVMEVDPKYKEAFEKTTLLPRAGQPIDVAYTALFLASDESKFITGANYTVDGGWSQIGGTLRN